MLISDLLRRSARRFGTKDAVVMADGSGRHTFEELDRRSTRLANALADLADPGDRVALLSENNLAYVEAYFGVPAAGMTLTLLNYRLHPREWAWILQDSGTRVLMVEPRYLAAVQDLRAELPDLEHIVVIGESAHGLPSYEDLLGAASPVPGELRVDADQTAWLLYTSGTTGRPKGAELSHRNLTTAMTQSARAYGVVAETCFLNAMPLCHVAGYLIPMHLMEGSTVVLMSAWDPESWMRAVQEHRVTSGGFAPTMMQMLLTHPAIDDYDLSSLTAMGYGASKIPVEVLRRTVARFGDIVYGSLGMTELAGNILLLDQAAHVRAAHGEEHLLEAAGKPMSMVEVRLLNSRGEECEPGVVGEIVVRGEQVTRGYFNNTAATAAAFTDGWFRTGDLARADEEGFLYVVDRASDLIISGGENVYPSEVENAIYGHPDVLQAAVVGIPDQTWGEIVTAVVVRRPGSDLTEADVVARCTERLARFKRPRRVLFLDQLPQTVTGKVQKHRLRDAISAPTDPTPTPPIEVEEKQ